MQVRFYELAALAVAELARRGIGERGLARVAELACTGSAGSRKLQLAH